VQKVKAECSAAQNEAQMREKQAKKLMDKLHKANADIDAIEKNRQ